MTHKSIPVLVDFASQCAADGVTLSIEKGDFCVIVGPSGAGKTTVLNILGGMDTCDSGVVMLDGQDIAKMNSRQLTLYRRHDVGFVFQFYNLVQNLTARYASTRSTPRKRSSRWGWATA